MALGSIITGVATGLSALSGLKSASAASRAQDQNSKLIDAQIDQINRINTIYDEGAGDLEAAIAAFLQQNGDAGFFNPGRIDDMASLFTSERGRERDNIAFQMAQALTGVDPAMYDSLGRTASLSSKLAPSTVGGVRMPGTDVGAYDGLNDANILALAEQYRAMFDKNTERQVSDMLADVDNQAIRSGTQMSTAGLEARQRAAETASAAFDENVLKAMEASLGTLGQRQALDAGNQNMRLAEFGAGLNKAELQRALAAMGFEQNLAGLQAAQSMENNALGRYWTNRQNALGEMAAIEGLLPNDALKSYTSALGIEGALADLRGKGISEISALATGPSTYRATGAETAGKLGAYGAATSAQSLATNANLATDAFKSVGTGLDKLFKNVSWDNIFGGSSSSSVPSFKTGFDSSSPAAWAAY